MYDRIPMKVQLWGSQWNTRNYIKLKEMGADIVMAEQMDTADYTSLYDRGIKIIPLQTTLTVNYIARYSEGAYTIWEAEGKISQDGDAELERETSKTYITNKNGRNSIATYHGVASDTILWGPGYYQQRWYTIDSAQINYTATFHLLIDSISYPSNYPSIENNEDVVCTLQVTTTELVYDTTLCRWYKGDVFVIDTPRIIKVKDFAGFGVWDTLNLGYNLMSVPVPKYSGNENKSLKKDASSDPPNIIRYIEFKIIWSGLSYVQLFTDKIVLQDERGRDLSVNPLTKDQICKMSQNFYTGWSPNFETTVLGWHTKDEPDWIDHLEPIRFINHLIDSANGGNRQLFITIASNWNGRFGDSNFGSENVSKVEEILKRNKMQGNQINYYLYDYPWNEADPQYLGGATNIENMIDWHLNKINKLDTVFVLSLQTGLWNAKEGLLEKIPTKEQFLYNLNVGLLYGAKEIDVSNYFYKFNFYDDTTNTSALYNYFDNYYTPLWFTIRDTVSPRLKNSFGKTLRNIYQKEQNPKLQLPVTQTINSTYNWLSSITYLTGDNSSGTDFIDVGFFETYNGSGDVPYFMVVNRWYNTAAQGDLLKISIDKTNTGYTNYNVTNFIENTKQTIVNQGYITMPHIPGEARLFKVYPVLKDGGSLVVSETTHPNDVLLGDMTIENGATLTINDTYYAKANIKVKSGGKIVAGPNGKIIFDLNKGLIIDGNAQVNGTSNNNRLTLEFNSNTSVGVEVWFSKALTMFYCDIKNASVGINAENGSTVNISNVNFTNCLNSGVALFQFGNGDSYSTLNTPTIYRCTFRWCGMGISAVNCSEVVIKENSIIECDLGVYLNMVNSAYITSNNILGWQSNTGSTMPGISMQSCGGYLRNNLIRYHNFGVLLAHSSPVLGVNTIAYNYKCGLFIDIGSYPNLVQQLANPTCWYPIGGCNIIKNNGTFMYLPPSTPQIIPDGAEIFLNIADVRLSYGYNEISDDRAGIPEYLTLPLIKGTRSRGAREFFVDRNYWGEVGPSLLRFGTLNAVYDPAAEYCPLPDMPCSGNEIIIQTTDGIAVDTIGSRERDSGELAALEESYALADKLFYSGDLEGAKIIYEQIVAGPYTSEEKLYAYKKLYEIGEILKKDAAYFTALQNSLNSILSVETDTLLIKTYNQSSILCDVSKEEYITAISKFDNIIQQNPNSEEAVYAEIDIMTTALNLDTTNTGLGKIAGGKYLVKGTSDYLTKLNNLLQNKFGINSEEKEQIIPKEYSLYQNYPNPFNPTTTIKFDLPKDGLVTLDIYDILGRRITTLINENKIAGSYEQIFDASSLASGVYVYKLQAGDFINFKKMLLLK